MMTAEAQYRRQIQDAYGLEDEGKLDEALVRIRAVLRLADDLHVVTTLEEHLRLPHLLQRPGKTEEAQRAFERLLEQGYPDQLQNPAVQWKERGLIYDAMRRAFTREGLVAEAALYEGLSYLADTYGQFLDTHQTGRHRSRVLSRDWVVGVADDIVSSLSGGPSQPKIADLLAGAVERFEKTEGTSLLQDTEEKLRRLLGIGETEE